MSENSIERSRLTQNIKLITKGLINNFNSFKINKKMKNIVLTKYDRIFLWKFVAELTMTDNVNLQYKAAFKIAKEKPNEYQNKFASYRRLMDRKWLKLAKTEAFVGEGGLIENATLIEEIIIIERPNITYCPELHVTSMLLCQHLEPQNSYLILTRLFNKSLINESHITYLNGIYVLIEIIKKYCRNKLAKKIILFKDNSETFFLNWKFWVFNLPQNILLYLMDRLILKGIKCLYKACIVILILYFKTNSKSVQNVVDDDIVEFVNVYNWELNKFIKVYNSINSFSRRDILKISLVFFKKAKTKDYEILLDKELSEEMEDFLNYTDAAKSHILTLEMWNNLYNTFIATVKIKLPILLFSSRDDGFSFLTFYRKVENYTYTILLVSTSDSQIFGALCSQDWNKRIPTNKRKFSYFGNGETFVFKMTENKMSVYGWTEKKKDGVDSFIYGDDTTIIVGGGTTGAIRFVNGDLSKGYTAHSETFGNEPLITSSTEISEFTTGILECYGMS